MRFRDAPRTCVRWRSSTRSTRMPMSPRSIAIGVLRSVIVPQLGLEVPPPRARARVIGEEERREAIALAVLVEEPLPHGRCVRDIEPAFVRVAETNAVRLILEVAAVPVHPGGKAQRGAKLCGKLRGAIVDGSGRQNHRETAKLAPRGPLHLPARMLVRV